MGAQAKVVPCNCGEADCPGQQWACEFVEAGLHDIGPGDCLACYNDYGISRPANLCDEHGGHAKKLDQPGTH